MQKIKQASRWFRRLFQVCFWILPVLLVVFWLRAPDSWLSETPFKLSFLPESITMGIVYDAEIVPKAAQSQMNYDLEPSTKLLGFLISLIPLTIMELTLYFLIRLFKLYEKGEIFSPQNVNYCRNIGYTLLASQVLNPIYHGLMSATMTWHNPPGQRYASFSFTGTNISIILIALGIILISWIMAEGCKLQEEQRFTI
jgi:hypothetical protein